VVGEEFGYALPEDALGRRVADAVAATGKSHDLDVFSIANQFVDQQQRVGIVHVVVALAMGDQQLAFQIAGVFDGRGILVVLLVPGQKAHVTFGVNCVVEVPVGYRSAGKTHFVNIS